MKPKFSIILLIFCLFMLLIPACVPDDSPPPPPDPSEKLDLTPFELELPNHFPEMPIPSDNPLTIAKVTLGKKLFFDSLLSVDNSISCASCHLQENAFSDPARFSLGVGGLIGDRQAMPIFNIGYSPTFFWDGRSASLEAQALDPIENPVEMKNTVVEVVRRLNEDDDYIELFHIAFGKNPNAQSLARALASFERTLISDDAPYDKFIKGIAPLTPSQQRGWLLFNSEEGDCFHCHNGHNNTTFEFLNNGLKEVYEDQGRADVTGLDSDVGKFKVPSLRNLKFTAPYMHDGSLETLEDVIEFYNTGGSGHRNQDVNITPLNFRPQQKEDLLNFLLSLSDEEFIVDEEYK